MKKLNFLVDTYKHYEASNCLTRAGSLAFTTILGLVPLFVVILGVLALLPLSYLWQFHIQNFIFNNFIVTSGNIVQYYLNDFVVKAHKISFIGLLIFLLTAVDILFALEQALNVIWHVHKRRHLLRAFLMYVLILLVAPICLLASFSLTFAVRHVALLHMLFGWVTLSVGGLNFLALIISWLAFLFLLKVIPHCHVPLKGAILGAGVAAIIFEIAKHIFAWYIVAFPNYEIIYGTLAIIPLFFLWIYIVWAVFLFGAVVSYMLRE